MFASLSNRPYNHMGGVETTVSRIRNCINGNGQLGDMQQRSAWRYATVVSLVICSSGQLGDMQQWPAWRYAAVVSLAICSSGQLGDMQQWSAW